MSYKQNQIRITPNSELLRIITEEAKKSYLPVSTYARICLIDYLKKKGIEFKEN